MNYILYPNFWSLLLQYLTTNGMYLFINTKPTLKRFKFGASEMGQWVKALITKLDNLSLMSGTQDPMNVEENLILHAGCL